MHMCLNHHPRVELMEKSMLRAHRVLSKPSTYDILQSRDSRSPQISQFPVGVLKCPSPYGTLRKKKRVVFADDKGLALAAIRIFTSDPLVSNVEEIVEEPPPAKSRKLRLRLGFAQPSADLPSFHESLKKSLVHLESCCLMYGSLFGMVRVCNIDSKKAVHVRITYDSWRSHQDIPCTPVQQNAESSETELFFFNVPVSSCRNVQNRLEFCVTFRPGSSNMLLWDTNGGQNYKILVDDVNSEDSQSVPYKNRPALYKSRSLSSFLSSTNMMKAESRQENILSKIPPSSDFNMDKPFSHEW